LFWGSFFLARKLERKPQHNLLKEENLFLEELLPRKRSGPFPPLTSFCKEGIGKLSVKEDPLSSSPPPSTFHAREGTPFLGERDPGGSRGDFLPF